MMMRAMTVIGVVALAGCTTLEAPGADALRGCWIERRGFETLTMRWFPDAAAAGAWRGDAMLYAGERVDSAALRLEPSGAAWRLCGLEAYGIDAASCTPAHFGDASPAPDEPYAEIFAAAETLRIVGIDDTRATVFDGARDGCD